MTRLPKVLVFTSTYEGKDYALENFLSHARKINYPNMRHLIIDNSATDVYYHKLKALGLDVVKIERGNNTRETLTRAQNYARQIALDEGYDYLMSLESDIMVPPTIVQDLLSCNMDVVTALYCIGDRAKGLRIPCITLPELHEGYGYYGTRLLKPEEYQEYLHHGLKRVQAGGMGCCLIYRRVFERLPFMYEIGLPGHSDIYFFNDCFRKHIPVFVQTDIFCDHQNQTWDNIVDR